MQKLIKLFLILLTCITCKADTLQLIVSSSFPPSQQFMAARVQAFYGEKLIADRGMPGIENVIHIRLSSVYIDGAPATPNIWAQSYASMWTGNNIGKIVFVGGAGRIDFDSANHFFWTDEVFSWVLAHEIAHFYGFMGPIWRWNGCLGLDTEYVGVAGLNAYVAERDAAAQFIPVVDSHFNNSLSPFLMTPSLNGSYISKTMLGVLVDNGNTLTPWGQSFQGGNLSGLLPRRPMRPIIVFNQ